MISQLYLLQTGESQGVWRETAPGPPGQARLFLPGWGFSGRVLLLAESPPACHYPDFVPTPTRFEQSLLGFLDRQGIVQVDLIGWSLGAHLAYDFALAHPRRVASLDLLAIRRAWPAREIEEIGAGLKQGPKDFLRAFYRKCFLGYQKAYRRFVAEQEEALLEACEPSDLLAGLDYLRSWRPLATGPDCPTRCRHGRRDLIAPLAEQLQLADADFFLIEHGGHPIFLDPEGFPGD